jgi:hypothetical protein
MLGLAFVDLEAHLPFFFLLVYLDGEFILYRFRNKGAIYVATEKGIGPPQEKILLRAGVVG